MSKPNQPEGIRQRKKKENLIQQIRDNKAKNLRRQESTLVEDPKQTLIFQQGITLGAPKFSVVMMNEPQGDTNTMSRNFTNPLTRKISREQSMVFGSQEGAPQFGSSRKATTLSLPSLAPQLQRQSMFREPELFSQQLQQHQQFWMRHSDQRGYEDQTPSVSSTPMATPLANAIATPLSAFQNYSDQQISSFSNYKFTPQHDQSGPTKSKKQEEKPTMKPSWISQIIGKLGLTSAKQAGTTPQFQTPPGNREFTNERRRSSEALSSRPKKNLHQMKSIVSKREEERMEATATSNKKQFYQIDIMEGPASKKAKPDPAEHTHVVKPKKEFIIPMDHPAKLTWNFFIFVLTLFNGVLLPVQLGFDKGSVPLIYSIAQSLLLMADICIHARTTIFHSDTGETVRNPRTVAKLYFFSFGFILDLLAALPLWAFGTVGGINLRIFTLLKFFRIQPTWALSVYSENAKLSLKILSLFGYLVLYIHITACCLHYVASQDKLWQPWQARFEHMDVDYYESDLLTQYLTALYTAILILLGDGTDPQSNLQVAVVSFFSVTGALVIANIFGTITLVVSALNRKAQKFQEKLDMANTSMSNMNLPGSIQRDIREFMMSTQCNLDTQKELDAFMQMVSPSLRNQVTKHIFLNAIARNPILQGSQEAIDFLINDVQVLLYMPEDHVVSQGEHGDSLYMIAKGDCTVWVVDHMRQQRFVRNLDQGEYFGEISILYNTPRTATVKSANYCTMAALSKKTFFGLCNNFPQIIVRMREKTLEYDDPWKQFRKKVLGEVEYFKTAAEDNPFFLDEVQYNLQEEYFEPNSEIVGPDCPVKQMSFVVQGKVDILVFDEEGNEMVLDSIGQGGIIGQYSVLFDDAPIFSAVARTRVRVLTLDQQFFLSNKQTISGLEQAVLNCEESVETSGIPLCDFQKFTRTRNVRHKLLQAKRKAKILETCLVISQLLKEEERKSNKMKPVLDMAMWSKKGDRVRRQSIFQPAYGEDRLLAANKRRMLKKTISQYSVSKNKKESVTSSKHQGSNALNSSPSKPVEQISSSSSSIDSSSQSSSSSSSAESQSQSTSQIQIEKLGSSGQPRGRCLLQKKKKQPTKKASKSTKSVRIVEESKSGESPPFQQQSKLLRQFDMEQSMMYVLSEHSIEEDSSDSSFDESFSQPVTSMKGSTPQINYMVTPNFKRNHSPGAIQLGSSIVSFKKDQVPSPRKSNIKKQQPERKTSSFSNDRWLGKGQSAQMKAKVIQEGKNLAKRFNQPK